MAQVQRQPQPQKQKSAGEPPAASGAHTPTIKPEPKGEKLTPLQKAVVRLGHLANRTIKGEVYFAKFPEEVRSAVANARKWVETAKAAVEKLPADFQVPRPERTRRAVQIAVGQHVTLRDKRRETYAGLLGSDELQHGVEVVSLHGPMVAIRSAKGVSFLPKAHLKVTQQVAAGEEADE